MKQYSFLTEIKVEAGCLSAQIDHHFKKLARYGRMKPQTVENQRRAARKNAAGAIKLFKRKDLQRNEYGRQLKQAVDTDTKFDKEHHLL